MLAALAVVPIAMPSTADAASCVRFSTGHFDAAGNDNYAANLNGEYVKIKNYCSTTKSIGGWKLHDYNKIHTYTFSSTFKVGPGVTVTIYSGKGTNTATKRYWQRTYGAVWNNSAPEKAYLRNTSGTLMSSWTPY